MMTDSELIDALAYRLADVAGIDSHVLSNMGVRDRAYKMLGQTQDLIKNAAEVENSPSELETMAICSAALDGLMPASRRRVLAWLDAKHTPKLFPGL